MGASVDRLPRAWIALIAAVFGLFMLPVLGLGLSGGLPIKNGWLMLAMLLAYIVVVSGGIGLFFPGSWWLSAVTAWPLAPVGLPVVVALGAGYFASRLRTARLALK